MRQSSRILLASLLLISAKASADDKSAEALLQQMQSAVSQQNFELSMVKARQGRLEPIRFSHGVIDGKEVAHLSYLDGKTIEYLQRQDEYTFFENTHEPYTLKGARFPGVWASLVRMPLPRVLESYDPVLAGRSRAAGLVAQVVRLVPKEADKYGFVLWIDEQSHLLVRVDMVDREGNLVEQVLGVDLDRLPAPAPWLVKLAGEAGWQQAAPGTGTGRRLPGTAAAAELAPDLVAGGVQGALAGSASAGDHQPAGGLHDALRRAGGSLGLRCPGRSQAGGAPAVDPPGRHLAGELCQ